MEPDYLPKFAYVVELSVNQLAIQDSNTRRPLEARLTGQTDTSRGRHFSAVAVFWEVEGMGGEHTLYLH